jgi:hypothetical protein
MAVAIPLVAGYLALQWLGRTYGSTVAERRAPMPGDHSVVRPQVVATHAATISTPPERIWPWLVQVGWHRGGWYTPRWVDALLFPDNWPSSRQILDNYQTLEVGDFIPDGSPQTECGFVVREVEPASDCSWSRRRTYRSPGDRRAWRTSTGRGASGSRRSTTGAPREWCSGGVPESARDGSPPVRTS